MAGSACSWLDRKGQVPRVWDRGCISQYLLFDLTLHVFSPLLEGEKVCCSQSKASFLVLFPETWPQKFALDIFYLSSCTFVQCPLAKLFTYTCTHTHIHKFNSWFTRDFKTINHIESHLLAIHYRPFPHICCN